MTFRYTEGSAIKLMKHLYGLKQTDNYWQEKVRAIIMKKGFSPLISDDAIYFNPEIPVIIASYVDDCFLWERIKIIFRH